GCQRLQRGIGPGPANARNVTVRRVEGLKHWVRDRTIAEGIERPTIAVLCFRFVPILWAVARRRHKQELGRGWLNAGTADLRPQQTTGRQGDVAHDLTLHAKPRSASQQTIIGIATV